jgi:hypothetical protein
MAELNPQIALSGLLINRNDENLKQQRYQMNQREMQQQDQRQRSLADLLPQAAQGNQQAIDQLYSVDPDVALKMDDRQREMAKGKVADLSAAVRWADTPEKWQYVQQHYGQEGIDLSPYQFQDREKSMVALGQLGSYLDGAPKGTALQQNYQFFAEKDPKLADQYLRNQAEGSPLIASNGDGTFTIIPRGYGTGTAPSAGGSSVPSQAVEYLKAHPELAPQFDQKYGAGAAQRALGGQMGSGPSGGFL